MTETQHSSPFPVPEKRAGSVELTAHDAAIIKGMLARGDRQSDVAAYFQINQGRVNKILHGMTPEFRNVQAAPADTLPPPGPYVVVNRLEHEAVVAKAELLRELKREFEGIVSSFMARFDELEKVSCR